MTQLIWVDANKQKRAAKDVTQMINRADMMWIPNSLLPSTLVDIVNELFAGRALCITEITKIIGLEQFCSSIGYIGNQTCIIYEQNK